MITAHADLVGSLLRPAELIAARAQLAAGEIDTSRFREIEDRAVWMNGRGSDFPF
jgi:methionine synthase II (cobalamin-independent)